MANPIKRMIEHLKPKHRLPEKPIPHPRKQGLIVVQIPAKNEEKKIGEVIKNIPKEIMDYKVVKLVINDASTDNTVKVAQDSGADYVLNRKMSTGLGNTFKHGIETGLKLGADIIVNIDGDGQFNPNDIPLLVEPIITKEADMVTTTRFLVPKLTHNMPKMKKFGNWAYAKLVSFITKKKISDTSCGFRAYSREAALRMNLRGGFTYTQEALIDLIEKGMKIKEVPLEVHYFKERKSILTGNLFKYGIRSVGIMGRATRDTQPLTFFGLPGIITLILGILGATYSFWFWLTHLMTTPVRTLFSVSVFFMIFGISLIVLALLADMLKSMHKTQEEILYQLKKREYQTK